MKPACTPKVGFGILLLMPEFPVGLRIFHFCAPPPRQCGLFLPRRSWSAHTRDSAAASLGKALFCAARVCEGRMQERHTEVDIIPQFLKLIYCKAILNPTQSGLESTESRHFIEESIAMSSQPAQGRGYQRRRVLKLFTVQRNPELGVCPTLRGYEAHES